MTTTASTPPGGGTARASVDVLLPVLNESTLVGPLVDRLLRSAPATAISRIVVIDGGSSDDTVAIALHRAARVPDRVWVLRRAPGNKAGQIRAGLSMSTAAWVLVLDADAQLPDDAIAAMLAATERHPRAMVIAPRLLPRTSYALETCHWRVWSAGVSVLRRLTGRGFAFGPCYLARRQWLSALPPTVTADDAYMNALACEQGCVVVPVDVVVHEVRTAASFGRWCRHKFYRALRFLLAWLSLAHRWPAMDAPGRTIYTAQVAVLAALPLVICGGLTALLLWWRPNGVRVVLLAASVLLGVRLTRARTPAVARAASWLVWPVAIGGILSAAWLACPFARHSRLSWRLPS